MYASFFEACAKSVNDLLELVLSFFSMLGVRDWFCIVWVNVCICML